MLREGHIFLNLQIILYCTYSKCKRCYYNSDRGLYLTFRTSFKNRKIKSLLSKLLSDLLKYIYVYKHMSLFPLNFAGILKSCICVIVENIIKVNHSKMYTQYYIHNKIHWYSIPYTQYNQQQHVPIVARIKLFSIGINKLS